MSFEPSSSVSPRGSFSSDLNRETYDSKEEEFDDDNFSQISEPATEEEKRFWFPWAGKIYDEEIEATGLKGFGLTVWKVVRIVCSGFWDLISAPFRALFGEKAVETEEEIAKRDLNLIERADKASTATSELQKVEEDLKSFNEHRKKIEDLGEGDEREKLLEQMEQLLENVSNFVDKNKESNEPRVQALKAQLEEIEKENTKKAPINHSLSKEVGNIIGLMNLIEGLITNLEKGLTIEGGLNESFQLSIQNLEKEFSEVDEKMKGLSSEDFSTLEPQLKALRERFQALKEKASSSHSPSE